MIESLKQIISQPDNVTGKILRKLDIVQSLEHIARKSKSSDGGAVIWELCPCVRCQERYGSDAR